MWQLIASLVSSAASAYGANKQGRVSTQNAREQRAWQTLRRNRNNTIEWRLVLDKTKAKGRAGTKEL
jgi:hypothetical protein